AHYLWAQGLERRQRSWFRRDHRITWLDGAASGNVDRVLRVWRDVS
ncbi:MAG: tRNA (adenosine(37)-N6)-dimethylallyltransferase MiaA, partial [Mycobacterium sp.]|nr:tRNA (adenosine(37)-N6)-dimethylallyltransferase MiaA [Mycobacterium sp.]